jgi:predicted DNA binding CopG/RHH family protein
MSETWNKSLLDQLVLDICIKRRCGSMKKRLPKISTDEEVEKLLESDLSDYLNEENFSIVAF